MLFLYQGASIGSRRGRCKGHGSDTAHTLLKGDEAGRSTELRGELLLACQIRKKELLGHWTCGRSRRERGAIMNW